MAQYCFYYDEANNSTKINEKYMQVDGRNIFIGVFAGWDKKITTSVEQDFLIMEEKLMKKFNFVDEFKGEVISSQKNFKCGINSFSFKHLIIYQEYFNFLNKHNIKMHISFQSQLTYIVEQVLIDLMHGHNTPTDTYVLTKMIYLRRPRELLNNLLTGNTETIKRQIMRFLNDAIREDKYDKSLKENEIQACKFLVAKLNAFSNIDVTLKYEWDYARTMNDFKLYYKDVNLQESSLELIIDNHEQTLNAFSSTSKISMKCGDSKQYVGLRIADIMASMLSKFLTALSRDSNYGFNDLTPIKKHLINPEFLYFRDKNKQLKFDLYKSMASFFINQNNSYYQFAHDEYADDFWSFIAILNVFNNIENFEEYLKLSQKELQFNMTEYEMLFLNNHHQNLIVASLF